MTWRDVVLQSSPIPTGFGRKPDGLSEMTVSLPRPSDRVIYVLYGVMNRTKPRGPCYPYA